MFAFLLFDPKDLGNMFLCITANFQQTILYHIPETITLHVYQHENIKLMCETYCLHSYKVLEAEMFACLKLLLHCAV
jgi:hypothetical protein